MTTAVPVVRAHAPAQDDTDARLETWRRPAHAIVAIALILGAGLRFYRLGMEEMSRGEAAAWTAAAASDLRHVFIASQQLDPGKAGIYDLVLHLWITAVGDSVGAMRLLSALLGTLSIALVFLAVRALFLAFDQRFDRRVATTSAALAALLYACNLQFVTIDRTSRMYPLMLAAIFAQIWTFAKAYRYADARWVVGVAFCTVLAVAANFTALFFFAAEGVWLAFLWISSARRDSSASSVWRPAAGLALAAAFFLPLGIIDGRIAVRVLDAGILGSIPPQSPWWPLRAIQVMTGNAAFWPMLLLAAFAIGRLIKTSSAVRFVLCWILLPFALVEAVSFAITPIMVERYTLPSLAGFLVLAAIGLALIPSDAARYVIVALVVGQSLAHIHHHWRTPEDVQWREAARLAIAVAPDREQVAVMPPQEPLMVLRYYLPASEHPRLVGADAKLDSSRVWQLRCDDALPVVIASTELPPSSLAQVRACYPRLAGRFRLVEVRQR